MWQFQNATDAGYEDYKAANESRALRLYVGANDGMFHVFDGTDDSSTGGTEVFAYVPSAAATRLSALTDPTYSGRRIQAWTAVPKGSVGRDGSGGLFGRFTWPPFWPSVRCGISPEDQASAESPSRST